MDQSADPCVDFYQFACGTYVAETQLEPTESKTGTFYEVRDRVDNAARAIVESPVDSGDAVSIANLKIMNTACYDEGKWHIVNLSSIVVWYCCCCCCCHADTIESLGYASFVDILVVDPASVGMPLLVTDWDESQFSWEQVSGENSRFGILGNNNFFYFLRLCFI